MNITMIQKKVHNHYIINEGVFSLISIILYKIFSIFCFPKQKKGKKIKTTNKLFGYIIYNERIQNDDNCCRDFLSKNFNCDCDCDCSKCIEYRDDCKICCQTCNLSLCFYMYSCVLCYKSIRNLIAIVLIDKFTINIKQEKLKILAN